LKNYLGSGSHLPDGGKGETLKGGSQGRKKGKGGKRTGRGGVEGCAGGICTEKVGPVIRVLTPHPKEKKKKE